MTTVDQKFHSLLVQRDLEGITGYISGEYNCVFDRVNGTIYVGSMAVLFTGSYFLFEKRIQLKWEDIRRVQKVDLGIEIIMKDEATHAFCNLHNAERAFLTLISAQNDYLMDRPNRKRSTSLTMLRRRNSDPLQAAANEASMDFIEETEATPERDTSQSKHDQAVAITAESSFSLDWNEACEVGQNVRKIKIGAIPCNHNRVHGRLYAGDQTIFFYGKRFFWDKTTALIPFAAVRQIQLNEKDSGIVVISKRGEVLRFSKMKDPSNVWSMLVTLQNNILTEKSPPKSRPSHRRMNSDPLMSATIDVDDGTDATSEGPTSASDVVSTRSTQDSSEVPESWDAFVVSGKYDNKILLDEEIPCSLSDFYDKFLENEAPFSIAKFLSQRGDSNLNESTWTLDQEESKVKRRVITYTHPVNAPMAPPQADARKEQKLIRFPNAICVETKTFVDDVPMTDCFFVGDRIRVLKKDESHVLLTLEFDITFVKSTMFQSIISKTTKREFTAFFDEMAVYIKRNVGSSFGKEASTINEPPRVVTVIEKPQFMPTVLSSPLLLLVLVIQVWLALELREMRKAIEDSNQCRILEESET